MITPIRGRKPKTKSKGTILYTIRNDNPDKGTETLYQKWFHCKSFY